MTMTNETQTAVDSLTTFVAGSTVDFPATLLENYGVYNLTGKTVTATIRQLRMPKVVLGSGQYENLAVALGNDEVTVAFGGVELQAVTLTAANFPVQTSPTDPEPYFVRFYVVDDNAYAQMLLFGIVGNENIP